MEDIEDLVGLGVDVDVPRHRNSVMPRVRRRKKVAAAKEVRISSMFTSSFHKSIFRTITFEVLWCNICFIPLTDIWILLRAPIDLFSHNHPAVHFAIPCQSLEVSKEACFHLIICSAG